MNYNRHLPAVCSILLLTGAAANSLAQAPVPPPTAGSAIAQATPTTPPLVPTAPTTPTGPGVNAATVPAATPTPTMSAPMTGADATPPPLDPNAPAPIAPPPVINGQPGATAPTAGGLPPAVDTNASANAGAARSRDFQGEDVGNALRILARQARINLVVSAQVVGTLSMRLEDVTALQAIQIICQAQGYDLTQLNGVYFVKTQAERAAEPTQSDYYTFSYARAAAIVPLLTTQLRSKASPPQIDERTNTVFYQEAKSNVDVIRRFLAQVDRPTRQVMIEARLVEVNANPTQSYGINWGGVFGSAGSPKTFAYGGTGVPTQKQNPDGSFLNTYPINTGSDGSIIPGGLATSGRLNDFGSLFGGALSQTTILSIPQFSATLRLLNEDADSEFIANPRVVTADNLEATIKIVRNQPVPQLNFNEQTATAVFGGFQDKIFGSTLVVKPSINKDNFITMSVKPEISNRVGDQVFNFAGAAVSSPIIDTRTLEANVLIKSGCTLAIGGLLQDQTTKGATKVPLLGDIPVLGYLFQEKLNTRNKRDLLIFVTPTIVSDTYGTGLEDQINGLKSINPRTEYANPQGWRNNAKGALHLRKPDDTPLASQYPVPGDCNTTVSFKDSVPRGR